MKLGAALGCALLALAASGAGRAPAGPAGAAGSLQGAVAELTRAEDLLAVSAGTLAVAAAQDALTAARAEGDPALEVRALALLGAAREERGDRQGAEAAYSEAETLASTAGRPDWRAVVLIRRSASDWRRADYDRARTGGEQALLLAEQAGDRSLQGEALLALGRADVKRGDYASALARYGRALALAELAGDLRLEALAHEALAFAYLDRRLHASALEHSAAALAIHTRLESAAGRARVLEDVAVLFLFQGNFEDALAAAERSLAIAESPGGDPASVALARQARAGALRGLGHHDEARAELERALEIRRRLGDPRESAWLIARLGRLAADLERPAEALARYREALEIWIGLEEWRPAAWYLIEAARASERLERSAEARALYRSAIELAERIELPYRSRALGGLARLEARSGDQAAAELDGARAVEAALGTGNLEMIWVAYDDLAEVELAFGRRAEALEHLRAALAAIEALRAESVPSDRGKRAEIEERQRVYGRTISLLFELQLHEEALEVAERARARASLDLFASVGSRDNATVAAELAAVAAAAVPSPRAASVPPIASLLAEVRSRGVTAIEYFVTESRLFAWVIEPEGGVHAVATPMAPGALEAAIRNARERSLANESDATSGAGADPLRELDRILIEPIARWLPSDPARTLLVVPHERLFLVPFAALRDAAGDYLVERHAIAHTPSLALLAWTGRPRRGGASEAPALVVGNPTMPRLPGGGEALPPLPDAEVEARAVARALPGQAIVLVGASASEQEVRRRAPSAPLIHLATHGVLDRADPAESLVALAPSAAPAERDGRWTLAEIEQATLSADLVTLSACDSGLGRISGDGVLGLSRAFLVAGAKSVLVSLWRVAEVPTRFQMESFYRALAENGGDRARALREAQLATLSALRQGTLQTSSGRVIAESPAHWAPFVLLGEPR